MKYDEAYKILRAETLKYVESMPQGVSARKLGVTQPYLSHFKKGNVSFSFGKLLKMCDTLEIDWLAALNKR